MKKELYFGCLYDEYEESTMILVLKDGTEVEVPNMYVAVSFINGIYEGQVEKVLHNKVYSVKKAIVE